MLQQILALIHRGEVGTQSQLAQQLHIPDPLADQMIQELVAKGYLEYLETAQTCGEGCAGCFLQAACGTGRTPRVWTLTDKGRRAVMQRR